LIGEDLIQHGYCLYGLLVENMKKPEPLSAWDIAYSVDMAIACLISYSIMTYALSEVTDSANDYLGGMWATVATVFVFRDTREGSLSAGVARFMATCVSFALCLLYLSFFPFTPVGMPYCSVSALRS
jgi:hypothetical protein